MSFGADELRKSDLRTACSLFAFKYAIISPTCLVVTSAAPLPLADACPLASNIFLIEVAIVGEREERGWTEDSLYCRSRER